MNFTIPKEKIIKLLNKQIKNVFFLSKHESNILKKYYDEVLKRCEKCFFQNPNKYYKKEINGRNDDVYFNPYHSVQYMIFLYYFSNTLYYNTLEKELCDKIYYLNKMLNGVDIYPAVQLPSFFMAEHPVGSVIGRAKIGEGFMFFQNCTLGGIERDKKEIYPELGNNVIMYAGSSILGECIIGNNVNIGAGAIVKNQNIPENHTVFGVSPNLIIK